MGYRRAIRVSSRLPVHAYRELVEIGGLLFYGPSYADLHRRAAAYVDSIVKGTKPADLPVERPVKFVLIINLKAANRSASKCRRSYSRWPTRANAIANPHGSRGREGHEWGPMKCVGTPAYSILLRLKLAIMLLKSAATHRPPVWCQFYGMAQVQRRGEEDAALVPKLIEATRDA